MKRILLDTNIYDKLKNDEPTIVLINKLINERKIEIILPRAVDEELMSPPFKGTPKFFPHHFTSNSVPRAGIMRAGDSLGKGTVFDNHLGASKRFNDALIVDNASLNADVLVTENDKVFRKVTNNEHRIKCMKYISFTNYLLSL